MENNQVLSLFHLNYIFPLIRLSQDQFTSLWADALWKLLLWFLDQEQTAILQD